VLIFFKQVRVMEKMEVDSIAGLKLNDYLRSIFDSSPFALISLDMRLRIVLFNRSAEKLTGFDCSSVTGRRVNRIIDYTHVKNIISTIRDAGRVNLNSYLTKLKGNNKRKIPVRLSISPLKDNDHKLLGILLIAVDVREVKRLQAQLLDAERLAAITETAISINHEINNPLCSILGNTQLILMTKEKLDKKTVRKLQSIEKEIMRIQEIARKLSEITRPVLKEYVSGTRMLDVEKSGTGKD
jgi:PAS domain S-box-containing protein